MTPISKHEYIYYMVIQMEYSIGLILFVLVKCLKQIELPINPYTCEPVSELPFYVSIMVYTLHSVAFCICTIFLCSKFRG